MNSPTKRTTNKVLLSSVCKKIAKQLKLPKDVVYEVYRAIPLHIVDALKQKKSVVFENLGVFTPHIMRSNLPHVPDTYKIRLKASQKLKTTMLKLATDENRQATPETIK